MKTFYISIGANLGKPLEQVQEAVRLLAQDEDIDVQAVSPWYETPPWGKTDQPVFINGAAAITTNLSGEELLQKCQAVEKALGRVRHEHWGARTIDLDIVYSPDETSQTKTLTLPHPYLLERAFVLVPLRDIAPDLVISGKTLSHWLKRIQQDVERIRQIQS